MLAKSFAHFFMWQVGAEDGDWMGDIYDQLMMSLQYDMFTLMILHDAAWFLQSVMLDFVGADDDDEG